MADAFKTQFVRVAQDAATRMARVYNDWVALSKVYTARGYAANGVNPIADADIVDTGLKASDMPALVALASEFLKFMQNQVPATGDYNATAAKLRTDM